MKLGFFTRNQGGTAHTDSIISRAETAMERGYITGIPVVYFERVTGLSVSYDRMALDIPDGDAHFWMGFISGIDFVRNGAPGGFRADGRLQD